MEYMYVYIYMYIYVYICMACPDNSAGTEFSVRGFKSHSDQFSIANSKNSLVVNLIWICSFPLNSCDCLRPEYNFYKLRQIVRQKRCYVRQGEFQTGYQTKLFLDKNEDIKSLCVNVSRKANLRRHNCHAMSKLI